MTFAVSGDAYDRFMGRYSRLLAPLLADFAGIAPPARALDVGCGSGTLLAELAARLGPSAVAAADPSTSLVEACRRRVPGSDVRLAPAESLPWEDARFDVALAQLVVNFMDDPNAGMREMRRVVREGGVVGACTWDLAGGMRMLRTFWDAALAFDVNAPDEARVRRFQSTEELDALWRGDRPARRRDHSARRCGRVRGLRRLLASVRERDRACGRVPRIARSRCASAAAR